MIRAFSTKVAKWMEQEGAISVKDRELFSFAVYSLLFGVLPIFIVAVLGFAFDMMREGLVMITPFMLIRKFSGGYHLKSAKLCVLISSILIGISLFCVKAVWTIGRTEILSLVVFISVVILWVYSPFECEARELTEKERVVFGVIVRLLLLVMLMIYFVLQATAPINFTASLGIGIMLSALLQIPCILRNCGILLQRKLKKRRNT